MIINHNLNSMNAHRNMSFNTAQTGKAMEKLSSGLRINRAGDDAAGLAISEKMRGQIRGLDQATRNSQDGISMIQTAEGALNETHSILQRMRELSVQSSNDTNTGDDRKEIQKEVEQLKSEINRISETTEFNTQKLLNGSLASVGASNNSANVEVVSTSGLKVGDYSVTVTTAATKAVGTGASYAADADVNTAFGATSKTISINGASIDTSNVTTKQELLNAINAKSTETGFVASFNTDELTFTANEFGSGKTLAITGADSALMSGTPGFTDGADAVVTVTNPDSVSQSVTGVGQEINYQGAEFLAKGNAATGATVTVASSGASLQIGANKDQNILVAINEISTNTLGGTSEGFVKDIDLRTKDGANSAVAVLDKAIQNVSGERSKLGATQNRLEHTISNLSTSAENLQAAESRIRDVDMAKEMMNFTKNNILNQAAQAMMSQSNQQPQAVLQLLR
ncbi:flagellin [Exiguobacterium sp. s36]|uniref:flagellin N-terminal helical domain-containing protein n=1 Tax=Exiguobacterium sp. s36 TaxID=2751227 RepID=UPI001BE64D33|nr:flagellin [Exiguobacterium sp. s36]